MTILSSFSTFLGWTNFCLWSISFYPQVIQNYKRKNVMGFSFDYVAYNISGYIFYTVFTITMYCFQKSNKLPLSVRMNDIAFALHALIMISIIIIQIILYRTRDQTLMKIHAIICGLIWVLVLVVLSIAVISKGQVILLLPSSAQDSMAIKLSFVVLLGYMKGVLSTLKYIPQAYLNYSLKSTQGFAIGGVLLDFSGGCLALAQQSLDALHMHSLVIFTSNVPKLFLSVITLFFNITFMIQHYVLYYNKGVPSLPTGMDEAEIELLQTIGEIESNRTN